MTSSTQCEVSGIRRHYAFSDQARLKRSTNLLLNNHMFVFDVISLWFHWPAVTAMIFFKPFSEI